MWHIPKATLKVKKLWNSSCMCHSIKGSEVIPQFNLNLNIWLRWVVNLTWGLSPWRKSTMCLWHRWLGRLQHCSGPFGKDKISCPWWDFNPGYSPHKPVTILTYYFRMWDNMVHAHKRPCRLPVRRDKLHDRKMAMFVFQQHEVMWRQWCHCGRVGSSNPWSRQCG